MARIASQELAKLLGWKTPFCAIGWAKKQGISYVIESYGPGFRYLFSKKEVLAKLEARKKIVTVREAAAILGVHPSTFKRWQRQGQIKAIGRGKRRTLLFKKALIVHFKPRSRAWVTWQEKILINGYNVYGLFRVKLARRIGKSIWAIGSKASRLGLSKYNKREFYFLEDVAESFQTNRSRVKRWIEQGKLEAKLIKSPGGRVRYRISLEKIAKFIRLFPKSWQGLKPLVDILTLPEYKKFNGPKT